MSNPNLYRPTDPDAENLLLRVEVEDLDPEDRWQERLAARVDAYTTGIPGFAAAGAMTPRQAHAYATRMQLGDLVRRNSRQYEIHPRFISVYHDSQLLGLAEYGSSGTDWGARLRYEGDVSAHMDSIGVVSEVDGRRLNRAEQYAIGALALYAVAVDSMTAESSPKGAVHTDLEYNIERINLDWILAKVDHLGLLPLLKQDEEVTPGAAHPVPVLSEAAMERRQFALPVKPLADALVAQEVWIAESAI